MNLKEKERDESIFTCGRVAGCVFVDVMLAVAPCASSWLAAGDAVCRLTVQLVPALCLLGCLLLPHSVRPIWWPLVIVYLQLPAAHGSPLFFSAANILSLNLSLIIYLLFMF